MATIDKKNMVKPVSYRQYYDVNYELEQKYNKLKTAAIISGAVILTVAAGVVGFNLGVIKMDKMICLGAMKGGIHKNLKDGGRIVCEYITKEQMAEIAKGAAKEVKV